MHVQMLAQILSPYDAIIGLAVVSNYLVYVYM